MTAGLAVWSRLRGPSSIKGVSCDLPVAQARLFQIEIALDAAPRLVGDLAVAQQHMDKLAFRGDQLARQFGSCRRDVRPIRIERSGNWLARISCRARSSFTTSSDSSTKIAVTKKFSASVIGEKAMARLREADEVAYVRFASVYRSFRDIDEFMAELGKLVKARETH